MTKTNKKITKKEREAFAIVGRMGGKATVKKKGRKHMSKIGKLGARARWGQK